MLVTLGFAGALEPGAAAALPAPSSSAPEPVVVRAILGARDLVVARSDGTTLHVRIPGVTAPEGVIDGQLVCGAQEAKDALATIAPPGVAAQLEPASRALEASWPEVKAATPPFTSGQADDPSPPVYAADGALYGELYFPAAVKPALRSVTAAMLSLGWMRSGVSMSAARADPSEIGIYPMNLVSADLLEPPAIRATRGVYSRCGGAFGAAAPVGAIPTNWATSSHGWVKAIGGASVHADTTKRVKRKGRMVTVTSFGRPGFERFVTAFGPGVVTLVPGGCVVDWPARGLAISSEVKVERRVRTPLAPPRTEEACFALPIKQYSAHGPAALLRGLPMRSSLRAIREAVGPIGRSRYDTAVGYTDGDTDNQRFVGQLSIEIDRRSRLAGLVLDLGP